ncbi:Rne/Rng family ribonuclease [Dactylosporangium roseum]|uniref:Rne/Rng family ribonuclease n=1 Tax=Dactylosporangium roseum TaxID=47989 RepID=A0ABY5Z4D6_9ACTN|nr:Rne/Rng family ribonuclease [Dactylosporangium roseum]UWZ35712.1 Rne/Rng family ribonuclease [Dactylosporangium roseum]
MFDNESASGEATGDEPVATAAANEAETATPVRRTRRRTTKAAAEAPVEEPAAAEEAAVPPPVTRRRRKAAVSDIPDETGEIGESGQQVLPIDEPVAPVKATRARRTRTRATAPEEASAAAPAEASGAASAQVPGAAPVGASAASIEGEPAAFPVEEPAASSLEEPVAEESAAEEPAGEVIEEAEPEVAEQPPARRGRRAVPAVQLLFMPPSEQVPPSVPTKPHDAEEEAAEEEPVGRSRRRRGRRVAEEAPAAVEAPAETDESEAESETEDEDEDDDLDSATRRRRRRGRRGRGRGRGAAGDEFDEAAEAEAEDETDEAAAEADASDDTEGDEDGEGLTRRRRRRRRKGAADAEAADDPHVVVKIREPRQVARDEVQGVSGSTRLEAKRQRRRDGREQRRTRPPILSEAEFLARREAVDREMVIRQKNDRTQIAVLEDKVLVEHYVTRATSSSMVGNVYLGRVQNVLPSMEAAFVDIGRGRNAVLYAGEVNWDATGLEGRTRTIEQALKSGDSVLVQVTKDPIGTKGARLTSHIALSGRHLVYVPNGNASGISRKLSDVERKRLRDVLKNLVPDGAGVIVRTAAEGASEDDLARDVKRLQAQWEAIQEKSATSSAPSPLYEEPELVVRVVRDLFNEDFRELVIQGNDAYESVEPYLSHVSPDLVDRVRRYTGTGDVFAEQRIDEQLIKALDRRVFLPSGGSLVIDRTEAMTVIDVNTGKYTGAGGNLEETVTRNNLEAAEEIVHQLRLRDLGGIIVIDFIDMVLESNRELVLRRLTECLGRDRTKHQVTEITSLGLVQMTRKRVGQGLLEAFSETCEVCKGRGLIIHTEPIPEKRGGGGGNGHSHAAVAKVASATVTTGVEEADAPAPARAGRRRGRRGAAAVAEESSEEMAEAVDATHVVEDVEEEAEFTPIATEDDPDNADEDEDEPSGNGARRRTRRGGVRRRTRP